MKPIVRCQKCGAVIPEDTQRYEWGLKGPVDCEKCILATMHLAFLIQEEAERRRK